MTTEERRARREALVSKIADAVRSTTYGDRSVTHADIEEMERALAILDREDAAASGTRTSRAMLVQHSNG